MVKKLLTLLEFSGFRFGREIGLIHVYEVHKSHNYRHPICYREEI